MSGSNLRSLTEATSVAPTDIVYFVINPGGVAADRKATLDTLFLSRTGSKNLTAYASLSAAVTAIGSSQATLEYPATTTVSASLTVPANITSVFRGTGIISVSSGQVLTINGPIIAPHRQIFTGTGSVIITNQTVVPQWYGAQGLTRVVTDGAMTVSGNTITCSTSTPFTASMVGWLVDMEGSGASVAGIDGITARDNQSGTITGYTSPSVVTVSFTAVATVSAKQVKFGPNDTAALQKAVASAASVYVPPGNYAHNGQISPGSGRVIYGDGMGVSILTPIGPTRSTGNFDSISVLDGVVGVTVKSLSILGCNRTALQVTSTSFVSFAIKVGGGGSGTIKDITFQNIEVAYIYGQGMRSNGDNGDQAGSTPTVINVKVLDCNVHDNADNGVNINTGGGLLISRCTLTDNGAAGIEFAGSRVQISDNYVARNRNAGIGLGGLGNPSLGVDNVVTGNLIERNGRTNFAGSGIQVGGNCVHAIIANNIIRENLLQGMGVTDGGADFATLSRDIRIIGNQIISNGEDATAGAHSGIDVNMNGTVIEGNDIFDDNVPGFTQAFGVAVRGDAVQVLRNRTRGHIQDYTFIQNSNSRLVLDQQDATIEQHEPNGYSGTVDTSGTAVTWESGVLFQAAWVGVPIKINSAPYLISAVAAAPTGNFTTSGLVVTRTSGPNFDLGWAGQYIKLGPTTYFPVASVAGVSTLTITNPIGVAVPASGTWELRGSMDLTLAATAGSQSDVAYVIPPHVIRLPGDGTMTHSFSAAPVFDAQQASSHIISLTGNVTSSTLANGSQGQEVTLMIQQDPATARTWVWPANVFGGMTIGATLSKWNTQTFMKTGANWYATGPGTTNLG